MRTIHKNLWRFHSVMTFEDAYQEAYVKFLELCERYGDTVDNARWFMGIYKRTFENLVTDFAKSANRIRRQVCFTELQEEDASVPYEELLRGDDSDAMLEILLEEAPDHVRQVLSLLANKDAAMLGVLAQSWERQGKRKLDGNEFLCRMLGYDHRKVDLVYGVQRYLEERANDEDR